MTPFERRTLKMFGDSGAPEIQPGSSSNESAGLNVAVVYVPAFNGPGLMWAAPTEELPAAAVGNAIVRHASATESHGTKSGGRRPNADRALFQAVRRVNAMEG